MDEKFLRPYDPKVVETKISQAWLDSGLYNPDNCVKEGVIESDAPVFSIVLPPPNVTGTLHVGHATMLAIEDIYVRFHRMRGHRTLWLPGTDHAAIATTTKVQKELEKNKVRWRDLGREKFIDEVKAFALESQDTIKEQVKALGASLDWSREAYTFDEARAKAVNAAFKNMHEADLIFRGDRIVNWDTKGQTTISDDEVVYKDETGKFYYFTYGPFSIGTSRPETKFGDKYVVMHPDDARYAKYEHRQEIELEWVNGPIIATIIKDEAVDPEFGTGVMTITPWHDATDFEIAERHNLEKVQIIDEFGKMLPIAGAEFAGLKINAAREAIVKRLDEKGLLEKIDDKYKHRIATAERSGGVIEPQIMKQWFVAVDKPFTIKHSEIEGIESGSETTLKQIMQTVVRNGQIKIVPERFDKTYFNWVDNLRDWCISRQIWFGHRVPVWYSPDGKSHLPESSVITFVRHGQSTSNADRTYAGGQIDAELTEVGKEQAHLAAKELEPETYDIIISSNLKRSQETAKIIAKDINHIPEIEIWPELNEADYGSYSGKEWDLTLSFKDKVTTGEGESFEELLKRTKIAAEKLKNLARDKSVLVCGHTSQLSLLFAVLEDQDIDAFLEKKSYGKIPNGIPIEKTFISEPKDKVGNVVFLHGFYRTREVIDPLTWLNEELSDPLNFWSILPGSDKPDYETQHDFVLENTQINEDTTVVCHSLGGLLALRTIEEKELRIKKLVLIATPLRVSEELQSDISGYPSDYEFDFEKIKSLVGEIVIFKPAEDHIIDEEHYTELEEKLGARLVASEDSSDHYNQSQAPEILAEIKRDVWWRDTDTLDTWFSSGLWTFSTLGWPDKTPDLKTFHPTSLLETGYDIIFFWVARMILMSGFHLGQVPFDTVYLHGLVRDSKGRKMSKSLGNIVDPRDMIEKYGSDALRMSLVVATTPGQDTNLSEDKIKAYKKFANKIWNATRFTLENTDDLNTFDSENLNEDDLKLWSEFEEFKQEITNLTQNHRFALAAEKLYSYFWHTFADVIIEEKKEALASSNDGIKESAQTLIILLLSDQIKMLHPFMPFITEEIWLSLPIAVKKQELLLVESWPSK